jgi:hypothetical protein
VTENRHISKACRAGLDSSPVGGTMEILFSASAVNKFEWTSAIESYVNTLYFSTRRKKLKLVA